jgi:hypothetical protein
MKYKTHSNGGRPFHVDVRGKEVTVNVMYKFENISNIFIGKGDGTEREVGNSILLHEEKLYYVFIGDIVFRFKAIAPITEFVSPVGNSDVPYPYAVDVKKNVYLLAEKTILIRCQFDEDPYNECLYPYHKIGVDEGLQEFLIGGERFEFIWDPRAFENYADLEKDGKLEIRITGGRIITLTKEKYMKIMNKWAEIRGYKVLRVTIINIPPMDE